MTYTQTMMLLEHAHENLSVALETVVDKYKELISLGSQASGEAKKKITVTRGDIAVHVFGVTLTAKPRKVIRDLQNSPYFSLEYVFAPDSGFGEKPDPVAVIHIDPHDGIIIKGKPAIAHEDWRSSIVIADHVIESALHSYVFKATKI